MSKKNFTKKMNTSWRTSLWMLVAMFTLALTPVNGVYGQEICTQTFSVSGQDDTPTVLTINAADVTCNGGEAINSITIKSAAGNLSNIYCDDWYDFTLNVDGTNLVTGCAADINNAVVTGFSTLTITSNDIDFWSDTVTIQIGLEVDHETPSCPMPPNVSLSDITSIGGQVEWDLVSQAMNGYQWVVVPEGDLPGFGTDVAFGFTSVSQDTDMFGGLSSFTPYDFYIRSLCGTGGNTSAWAGPFNFTTLPDFCGGDNFYDTGGASGNYGNNENITTVISPDTPGDVVTVTFLSFNTEANYDGLMIYDGPDTSAPLISSGSTSTSNATTNPLGAWNGTGAFSAQGESFTSTHSSGALTFVFRSDGSGTRAGWEAEVTCGPPPSCITPANLAVSNLTASGLDLSWDAEATAEDGYEWVIMPEGEAPDPGTAVATASPTGLTENIGGLDANTSYSAYVRSDCGVDGESDWSSAVNFTTLPDFCAGDNFYDSGGASGEYGNNENITTVISPDTSGDVVTVSFLSFNTEANYDGLMIYDGPDTSAPLIDSGFVPPFGPLSPGAWNGIGDFSAEGESFTSTHPSGALTFVFTSDGFGTRAGWEAEVTCAPPPTCIAPSITSSSASATSIQPNWDAEATATDGYDWVLMAGGENPIDHTPLQSGSVTTTFVNITGLTPNTSYSIFVRSNCGGGDVSDYSSPLTRTTPALEATPWTEDFNTAGQTGWSLAGWTRGTSFSSGGIEGRDGSAVIRRNLYGTAGNQNGFIETVNVGPIQAGDYLSYEYRLKDFYTPNDALASGACTFTVTASFSSSGAVILQSFSNDNKLGWQKKYIDLSDYEGETVQLSVLATANSEDFWLYFDNFAIKNVDGYVYADDSQGWLTVNPGGVSTDSDLVEVVEGSASFNDVVEADELVVFAQASLDIEDVLALDGELYTDGEVTFKSNATKTGQLASAAVVRGQVTTERFVPAGDNTTRGFRFITPTVDAGSIFNNWQEAGASPLGFGTHITGSTTGANGFDQTITGNPSLFVFDNTAATQAGGVAWIPASNTTSNLVAGTPYRIFVRGDRTIDLTEANPTPKNTVLRAKGNLVVGNRTTATFASEDLQFSFFGNPYQAIVDLNNVSFNGDVNNNYVYVWDVNLGTSGSYVTVELSSGTNTMSSNANNLLQPGQAAFIRNNSTGGVAPSIEFTEASKDVTGGQLTTFSTPTHAVLNVQLISPNNNGLVLDGIGMRFDNLFDNAVGDEDAGKIGNSGENMAIVRSNQLLSIERRNYPFQGETHQLFVNNLNLTNYALKIQTDNFNSDLDLFVVDHYLGTETLITTDSEYHFTVNSTVPASSHPLRFELKFDVISLGNENALAQNISLYPVPVKDRLNIQYINNDKLKVEIVNILGQVVGKFDVSGSNLHQIDMSNYSAGVYVVKINSENEQFTQQVIKK